MNNYHSLFNTLLINYLQLDKKNVTKKLSKLILRLCIYTMLAINGSNQKPQL